VKVNTSLSRFFLNPKQLAEPVIGRLLLAQRFAVVRRTVDIAPAAPAEGIARWVSPIDYLLALRFWAFLV
jgi:hypothetical protein